jgi:hypothetical protein
MRGFVVSLFCSIVAGVIAGSDIAGLAAAEPVAAPPSTAAAVSASADVRYYAVVFSYQDALARPRKCHTWATFAKVSLENGPDAVPLVEQHTISWLPCHFASSLYLTILPSAGKNHTLHETLALAARQCLPVCHWGPFEIDECLYRKACHQIVYLNSGAPRYKLIEPIRRIRAYRGAGGALHCTHAVTDVVGFAVTGTTRGYAAGRLVAGLYGGHARGPAPEWLYSALVATGATSGPTLAEAASDPGLAFVPSASVGLSSQGLLSARLDTERPD